MEILELIFGLIQACGCFLELGAAGANLFAGTQTVRYVKARRDGQSHNRMRYWMWIAWLVGIALLFLAFIRWVVLAPHKRMRTKRSSTDVTEDTDKKDQSSLSVHLRDIRDIRGDCFEEKLTVRRRASRQVGCRRFRSPPLWAAVRGQ